MLGTPTACWWREPVLSLFLRAQVTDCCSSPSGALQRHTPKTTTKAGQDSTLDVVKGPLHETWLRSAT